MNIYICDFCSEPNVAWSYPARNFIGLAVANVMAESIGAWAACPECHALIEAGDREGLAQRSAALLIVKQPEFALVRDDVLAQLSGLHSQFFEARTTSGPVAFGGANAA